MRALSRPPESDSIASSESQWHGVKYWVNGETLELEVIIVFSFRKRLFLWNDLPDLEIFAKPGLLMVFVSFVFFNDQEDLLPRGTTYLAVEQRLLV